ncbi:MAG TPA: Clp protease N-terminal domain-containing protein [Bryobacteraceae bacterium]|nr:Clp protease N-terminal domain-containing protein [Bryobacteraceae bacterium]
MFERYTETARRVIFFARYEASNTGSRYIECPHLVLGMLREDTPLRRQLDENQRNVLRESIVARFPRGEPVSTSVDMPLDQRAKTALAYAAEESQRLEDTYIGPEHILLGILRADAAMSELLSGFTSTWIVESRSRGPFGPDEHEHEIPFDSAQDVPEEDREPIAPALRAQIERLTDLMDNALRWLDRSALAGDETLKRRPWTRKQAIGHLIDWATAHHQIFARALTEPSVSVPALPEEGWVEAEGYNTLPWERVVRLWLALNGLIVHVLVRIPQEKLTVACRIGVALPQPLSKIVESYIDRCDDILGQMLLHPGK